MRPSSRTTLVLCLLTPLLFSAPAFASVLFRGDFETGDLSQWQAVEAGNPDHIGVVTDPVAQGKYAMRAEVDQGDLKNNGDRNEVDWFGQPTEGTERWYHWYTYWPEDFRSADTWEVFTQFHQYNTGGSPPVEFDIWGDEIRLTTNGVNNSSQTIHWRAPLVRGVWHSFLLHVKWSSDPSEGFLELYYDGQLVLPLTRTQTMPPGDTVYLKQGLYRNRTIDFPQTVYHDGMVVGTTRADVEPQSSGEPDGGTTSGGTVGGGTSDGGTTSGGTDAGTQPIDTGSGQTGAGQTGTGAGQAGSGAGNTPDGGTAPLASGPLEPGVGATAPLTGGCTSTGGGVPVALGLLPLAMGVLWFRRRRLAAQRCTPRSS